jgi:hypothetical protein
MDDLDECAGAWIHRVLHSTDPCAPPPALRAPDEIQFARAVLWRLRPFFLPWRRLPAETLSVLGFSTADDGLDGDYAWQASSCRRAVDALNCAMAVLYGETCVSLYSSTNGTCGSFSSLTEGTCTSFAKDACCAWEESTVAREPGDAVSGEDRLDQAQDSNSGDAKLAEHGKETAHRVGSLDEERWVQLTVPPLMQLIELDHRATHTSNTLRSIHLFLQWFCCGRYECVSSHWCEAMAEALLRKYWSIQTLFSSSTEDEEEAQKRVSLTNEILCCLFLLLKCFRENQWSMKVLERVWVAIVGDAGDALLRGKRDLEMQKMFWKHFENFLPLLGTTRLLFHWKVCENICIEMRS